MGFLGTLCLVLVVWCFQKYKEPKQVKTRLTTMLFVALASLVTSIILNVIGETKDDKGAAWMVITMYIIFFGWRIILDGILLNKLTITSPPKNNPTSQRAAPYNNHTHKEPLRLSRQSRQERWLAQAKRDEIILNRGDILAKQTLSAITAINAMWDMDICLDKDNKNSEFRSKMYLLALTPKLFLENYYLFKSGNHDDIMDAIYTERPYPVLETLIKMGVYIFETNNNILILKEIINGDKDEYTDFKMLAQQLLNEELNESIPKPTVNNSKSAPLNESYATTTKSTAIAFYDVFFRLEAEVGTRRIEGNMNDETMILLLEVCKTHIFAPQKHMLFLVSSVKSIYLNNGDAIVYSLKYRANSICEYASLILVSTRSKSLRLFSVETDIPDFFLCEFSGDRHINYDTVQLSDVYSRIDEILNKE